jgi:hypothetical protein
MKGNFDRRNVLKGLLTVPAAAAVGGWMNSCGKDGGNSNSKREAAPDSSSAALAPTTVDFSVVLHGAYALQFDTDKGRAQILIPTVLENGKEAHKYLSGLFRNEKPFALSSSVNVISVSGSASLPDVLTQNPSSEDPTKLVILRKKDLQLKPTSSGSPLRNVFELPYPRALTVLRAQKFKTAGQRFFSNDGMIPRTPTQVPLTLALQYNITVSGPFPVPNIHLHIFAEQLKAQGAPHITTAFTALTSLYVGDLGGLKMSNAVLNDVDSKPPSASILDEIKFAQSGFEPEESLSLEQRKGLPSGIGASHVGSCAGIIAVSGTGA